MSVEITPVVAESETGVPILDVRDLVKEFPVRAGLFRHAISTVMLGANAAASEAMPNTRRLNW